MTYSSSLSMSRQRYNMAGGGRNQNSVSFRGNERTLGPISNTILLIVLACLLGLLYLNITTSTNKLGFQVDDLKQQAATLESEYDDLQIASARLQSVERVRTSQVAANMAPVKPSGTVN